MLVRCEKCNQLYPEHHGECRHCRDGVVPSASKFKTGDLPPMTLRSRTGELTPPRPGTGELSPRSRTGELTPPPARPGTGELASRSRGELTPPTRPGTGELTASATRFGTGDLTPPPARTGTGEFSPAARAAAANLPSHIEQPKENETSSWQAGSGGLCPDCGNYNDGKVAFCFSCNAMLVRSHDKAEIVTAYPIKDIKGLVGTFVQNLAKMNIKTTEDILNQCATKQKRAFVASKSQMSDRSLLRLVHIADFCRVPDIDLEKAAMLELIGITDMKGFLLQTPDKLVAKLQQNKPQLNKQGILVLPIAKHIEKWLNDARQLPPIKIEA